MLTAIIITSMAATPLFVLLHGRFGPKPGISAEAVARPQDEGAPVVLIGFGRFGRIVSQTLFERGCSITALDTDPTMIPVAAAFGFRVFHGDGGRLDIRHAAAPTTARAVTMAVNDPAAATGAWRSRPTRTRILPDARSCFGKDAPDHPAACREETGHGRKATRTATVVSAEGLAEHHYFPGLKGLGRIGSTRGTDGRLQSETRWFALSWLPAPEVLLTSVRAHRATRNALRWQLDVTFREDAARNRKDNGPANIAVLRRRAPDIARRDTRTRCRPCLQPDADVF